MIEDKTIVIQTTSAVAYLFGQGFNISDLNNEQNYQTQTAYGHGYSVTTHKKLSFKCDTLIAPAPIAIITKARGNAPSIPAVTSIGATKIDVK